MNLSKRAFGVTSGKFLGFIVRQRGIEIEQAKIDAILRMPEPRNIHELKSLPEKLAYLWKFISNLAGRPLILYVATQERSVGILLAQKNDEGKENALYYLRRTMTPNELKYSPIEKLYLTLIFSIQKLKHYFKSHSIHLVSKANPLKYVMAKSVLLDRLARCNDETVQAIEETYSGVFGAHYSGPKLHFRIKRMGYYWPTMVKDCIDYARRCQAYQFHANLIHQLPESLHSTIASWPFDAWDYFSKWAEAVPLKEVKKENVADFIRTHIIYRYRVPRYIISDNGKPFCNSLIDKLCQKFGFKQRNSSMYYAAANGLAETFNKILCNLLKKVVAKLKRDWHERIEEALWAYRTTVRTPTQATHSALVYGVEAVLPLE
ncbi:UNVERIFIED_CONTAM: hypothetical protein Scaly_2038000 [Sesamum calycinum]|uniref:Integrase catalytic domain-containing protein n=1 Tax=Sesamum calycinum TaxID=2727403 RepID=A0AAW2N3R4_9LAMI